MGGDRWRFLPAIPRRHIESCNADARNEPLFSLGSATWPGLVSCNAKEPDFPTRSSGCINIISCNGSPIKAVFRQYPGFCARHACTRSTCCSPRKYSWFSCFRSQRRWLDCLLAARHSGSEQYLCRPRRRGSRLNSFWQHRHRRRRGLITGHSGPMGTESCPEPRRQPTSRDLDAVIPIAGFMIIDAGTASSSPFQHTPKIVHHHAGIVFTFIWNPRSRCAGNREHDRPEYAGVYPGQCECLSSL